MNCRYVVCICLLLFASGALAETHTVEIEEWLVPWENTRPRDPFVDQAGRVWFVGQTGDYVAKLVPEQGDFARYDLDRGTGPHNLIVSADGTVWYAGNMARHIGKLNPKTGLISKIMMPERRARDPHTLVFGNDGTIWFTAQHDNAIGKLDMGSGTVALIDVPTRKSRPYGIVINSQGEPWAVAFGSNHLLRVDPDAMTVEEISLPDKKSRPRRLVTTSNDDVWWVDHELGRLGRLKPATGDFSEWDMPGGSDSRPYGMAVDRFDRIWIVESGLSPNRLVGFDTASGEFFSITDIPSGGGSVRHMVYYEAAGEVWFGTDTNYIGRAAVH